MDQIIIRIICALFLVIGIILIWKKHNFSELIISDKFWLFVSWEFSLLLYCFAGIIYPIKLSLNLFIYIILFWMVYLVGSLLGKLFMRKKNDTETKEMFGKKANLFPYFIISLISTILYVTVAIYYNPGIKIGITRTVSLNALNTLCLILSSVSLIIWLYELLYSLINKKRTTIYGIISAILYNIPGIVISGRDALMIFIISTFIVVVYSILYLKKNDLLTKKMKKGIIIAGISFVVILLAYLFLVSSTRYGTGNNSVLKTFEEASQAKFPKYLVAIYKNTGVVGKLLLNIVFYYSSQFSKLTLIFDNYKGPYQFGLYQLHYVSRTLDTFIPNVSNLDIVSNKVGQICVKNGVAGTKVFWGTIIEYSIYDFGRIGSLVYALVLGFIIKVLTIKNKKILNEFSIIFLIMICVGMFTTVEVSPIFDYFYIFPLTWLVLLKIIQKK